MIELLLQAEDALGRGSVDQAERIYRQAIERDPQNAIAVVGLARVALARGDERTSYELSHRALAIDPENDAALRLTARLARTATPSVAQDGRAVLPTTDRTPEPAKAGGLLGRLFGRR
jgi:thioredoxin-like negative regulator of GroEL